MSRETDLLVSLTLATAIMGAFHAQLPPLSELRDQADTDHDPALRGTELQVAALSLGAGVGLSAATGSTWPAATALVMVVASLAMYEWGMRGKGA